MDSLQVDALKAAATHRTVLILKQILKEVDRCTIKWKQKTSKIRVKEMAGLLRNKHTAPQAYCQILIHDACTIKYSDYSFKS
jgi:hypothetical protein